MQFDDVDARFADAHLPWHRPRRLDVRDCRGHDANTLCEQHSRRTPILRHRRSHRCLDRKFQHRAPGMPLCYATTYRLLSPVNPRRHPNNLWADGRTTTSVDANWRSDSPAKTYERRSESNSVTIVGGSSTRSIYAARSQATSTGPRANSSI